MFFINMFPIYYFVLSNYYYPVEVISPAAGESCVTIRPAFETEPVLPVRLPVEIFPVEPTLILRVVTVGSPVNKLIDVD